MAAKFWLDRPRYDQSTYAGRVRHFSGVISPLTLFVTDAKLKQSLSLLDQFKRGELKNPDIEALWSAKRIKDAIIHPDTGEKVFLPFRMSAFVPVNIPIVVGMINSTGVAGTLFWQWFNQSYNVAVNYANRNASNSMSTQQILASYAGAVFTSCSLAVGLGKMAKMLEKRSGAIGTVAGALVPYTAVASAGAVNVFLMRRNEMKVGIAVKDRDGNVLGTSKQAGKTALYQTVLTRVFLPAPVLMVPAAVMTMVGKSAFIKTNPRYKAPIEIAVVTASLWGALPLSIGLFPQVCQAKTKELEPEFHNLKDKSGQPIDTVFFNKGL
jgi:tricarboxylate carrier